VRKSPRSERAQEEFTVKKKSPGINSCPPLKPPKWSGSGPKAELPTRANLCHTKASTDSDKVLQNIAKTERTPQDNAAYRFSSNVCYEETNPSTHADTTHEEYRLSSTACYSSSDYTKYEEVNTNTGNPNNYQENMDTDPMAMKSNVCYNKNTRSTENLQQSSLIYHEPDSNSAEGSNHQEVADKMGSVEQRGPSPGAIEVRLEQKCLTEGNIQKNTSPKSRKIKTTSKKTIIYESVQFGPILQHRQPPKEDSLAASGRYEPCFGEPAEGMVTYENVQFEQNSSSSTKEKDFKEESTRYEPVKP